MPGGARRWSGRQKGWPARQRHSSLLVSARQLQALVRQRHFTSWRRRQHLRPTRSRGWQRSWAAYSPIDGLFGSGEGSRVGRWQCAPRSEEHTSELQSQSNLVCRLLLEKKKKYSELKTDGQHLLFTEFNH